MTQRERERERGMEQAYRNTGTGRVRELSERASDVPDSAELARADFIR